MLVAAAVVKVVSPRGRFAPDGDYHKYFRGCDVAPNANLTPTPRPHLGVDQLPPVTAGHVIYDVMMSK